MQFGERELGTVSLDRKSAMAELRALGCTNCPAPRCSAQRQRDHVNRWRGHVDHLGRGCECSTTQDGRVSRPARDAGPARRNWQQSETLALPPLLIPEIAEASAASLDANPRLRSSQQKRSLPAELRIPWPTRTATTSPDIASGENERSIDRLSDEELLVNVECWQGDYDSDEACWSSTLRHRSRRR